MPSSRGFSQPRDATRISYVSCIGRQVLYTSVPIVLYTISPWELLNIHCHNTSFFMSYLSCSLSCTASSFSMDMGKSSFNLKSSYDHCWHPHNRIMRGIFTFFIRLFICYPKPQPRKQKVLFECMSPLAPSLFKCLSMALNSALTTKISVCVPLTPDWLKTPLLPPIKWLIPY